MNDQGPRGLEAPATSERLRRERDLYLGLLKLNTELDLESFLKRALEFVVGITGMERGYLEVFDPERTGDVFWHAVGFPDDQVERVRGLVSSGIVAEVIASGKSILTASALLDPRFRDRESVQSSRIDAVFCAPIGCDTPSGVLYLQTGHQREFSPEDMEPAELFTRHLAPLVDQLFLRRAKAEKDPTAELRRRLGAHEFVGRSHALADLLRNVEGVARLDIGVLIIGETGTGKTQLARLIHRNSQRAGGPFVELNCGAVQENLLEADLFGSLPGAYTGAVRREGKIAAAEGGTLLLDDVAELTLSSQAKLLQLLQDQRYYVLGSTRPSSANVRVIAATHVDLRQAVDERRFREDLYDRLKVFPILVPSLAERREDLRVLAIHFCKQAQREHRLAELELSPAALRAIESAEWNGNVRELRNQLLNAAVKASAERCERIEVSHLFPEQKAQRSEPSASTFQSETRNFQRQLLSRVLEENDWNVAATARRLDLTRAHVYNLIKSFGLER